MSIIVDEHKIEQISGKDWDKSYEVKAILLLFLGFGLVGIDRFIIMPMFPVLAKELNLNYSDIGLLTGALGIAWGFSSIFMGRFSDKVGHKAILIPSLVLFSLLAGFSGLATTLGSLLLIRIGIGLVEGAYTPSSIIATLDASKPSRVGLNIGLQQAAFPLFGLGIAPVLVTQLLNVVDWHFIFALVALPGFVVAYFMYKILRDNPQILANSPKEEKAEAVIKEASASKWYDIFKYRNVSLGVVSMFCWLTALTVLAAFLPNYLTDYLKLNLNQMGFILSAIGFGGTVGTICLPALSDKIGRKAAVSLSALGGGLSLLMLIQMDASSMTALFLVVFISVFFIYSLLALTVGPISAESVPKHLRSSSSGMVIGTGEIFSGSVVSFMVGMVAQVFGIQYILYVATGAMVLGFIVTLFLKETAPSKINRQNI